MFIRFTKIIKIMKSLPACMALRVFFKYFWQKQKGVRGFANIFADKTAGTKVPAKQIAELEELGVTVTMQID